MILTIEALNQLENKLTPHGMGLEIINESELTYNAVTTAITNGYLPVIKTIYNYNEDYSISYYDIYGASEYNSKYYVYTNAGSYTSSSINAIMTISQQNT